MLTYFSEVVKVSLEALMQVVELMEGVKTSYRDLPYDAVMYQDRRSGGGAWRVVWRNGVAWISRHAGYDHLDEEYELFVDLLKDAGAVPYMGKPPSLFDE